MTSLSKCCVSGHLHQGEPKGTVDKFAGLDTYITGTNASRTIMVITVCMKLDGRAVLIAGYLWDPVAGKHQTNHLEDRADQNRTSNSSRMNTRKPATCVSSCQTSFSVCVPIFKRQSADCAPRGFVGDAVPLHHMKSLTPLHSQPTPTDENKQAAFGDVGPWLGRHGDEKVDELFKQVLTRLRNDKDVVHIGGLSVAATSHR